MENIRIMPSSLKGEINIPPSKSLAHRAVICAGLSEGVSNISNIIYSQDIKATIEGMKSLGVEIENYSDNLSIRGRSYPILIKDTIDCIESGSTLRFLIP
ncbi:MAG: hypothetical protein ACFWTK_11170 [Clostridium sp.]